MGQTGEVVDRKTIDVVRALPGIILFLCRHPVLLPHLIRAASVTPGATRLVRMFECIHLTMR